MADQDKVVRVMTDDGAFRVVAARTTLTARAVIQAQNATPDTAQDLADLITCAVLYRETMAPNLRVQCIVRRSGDGTRLVADARPEGWVRGLIESRGGSQGDNDQTAGFLQMMRSLPNGDLHRGVVAAPVPWNLSDAFMRYMHQSEQIVSMISMGSSLEQASQIVHCGGFVVQVLPEARDADAAISKMTETLETWSRSSVWLEAHGDDIDALIETILRDTPFTHLSETEVKFGCSCSSMRVLTTLSTLGRSDLQEMVDDGKPIDITCDYCGKAYTIEPTQLRGLLATS